MKSSGHPFAAFSVFSLLTYFSLGKFVFFWKGSEKPREGSGLRTVCCGIVHRGGLCGLAHWPSSTLLRSFLKRLGV